MTEPDTDTPCPTCDGAEILERAPGYYVPCPTCSMIEPPDDEPPDDITGRYRPDVSVD